jgi:probable rRNA maturation factor
MRAAIDIEIALLNPNRYSEVSARRLRPWLREVLRELLRERPARGARGAGDAVSLGVRFAGDRAMRRANREFRGKDQTTDVLSFPGDGGADGANGAEEANGAAAGAGAGAHIGDVLVSVPQARRQAAAAGRDPAREVQVLLLHGVLHCLGHDHEVDGGEMERLERRLRRRWLGAAAARPRLRPSPVAALVAGRRTARRAR